MVDLTNFPFEFFKRFSHKISLYLFYTMMQKVKNGQKVKLGGVGGGGGWGDTFLIRQDLLDLSFWSFFTFLHHGIERVKSHRR